MGFPPVYARGDLEVEVIVRHRPSGDVAYSARIVADTLDFAVDPLTHSIEVTVAGILLDDVRAPDADSDKPSGPLSNPL